MEMASSVRELMHQGGWVMWALLIFSLVALTTAFERGLTLRRSRLEIGPFLSRLHQALHDRRSVAAALKVCDAEQGSIARVAEAALRRFSQPGAQLEKRLEHQAGVEVRRLRSGLGVLATAASTAPLLGFLGTVTGMMASFHALMDYGISNPGMVAQGIAEALTTTAAGLVVAVPAQIVHNALASRVDGITADIEEVANFLLEVREEQA